MFDIGWSELLLIGVVALVAIGPKELPGAIYQFGKWVRRARGVAREFQVHIDELMHQAELDDLRKQALAARDLDLNRMVEDTVDRDHSLRTALSPVETGAAGSSGSPPEADDEERPAPSASPTVSTPEKTA